MFLRVRLAKAPPDSAMVGWDMSTTHFRRLESVPDDVA